MCVVECCDPREVQNILRAKAFRMELRLLWARCWRLPSTWMSIASALNSYRGRPAGRSKTMDERSQPMSTRWCIAFVACVGTMVVGGCASRQIPPPAPAPVPFPAQRSAPALPPAQFVSAVGSADLFIERACALAAYRAGSPSVRQSAMMILQEHRQLSAELSLSARRLNLLPAASLPPDLLGQLERLQASSNFDDDFRAAIRAQHRRLVALLNSFARDRSSPTLRQTAVAILPAERRHLQLLGS